MQENMKKTLTVSSANLTKETISKEYLPDCCVCKNDIPDESDKNVVDPLSMYDDTSRYEEFIKLLMKDRRWEYDEAFIEFFEKISCEDTQRPPGSSRFIEFINTEFMELSRSQNITVSKAVKNIKKTTKKNATRNNIDK